MQFTSWTLAATLSAACLLATPAVSQELIGIRGNGTIYAFDPVTGCFTTQLGQVPGVQEINAMAKHPVTGNIFIAGGWSSVAMAILYEVDPENLSVLSTTQLYVSSGYFSCRGLAFSPSGELYAIGYDLLSPSCSLYSFDLGTGQGTFIGNPSATSVQALAFDAVNDRLVGWDVGLSAQQPGPGLIHIDKLTGQGVDPNPGAGSPNVGYVQGMGFDPSGRLLAIGFQSAIRELDPVTGVELWISSCSHAYNLRGLEYIPPDTITLAMTGSCPGTMTAELSGGTANGAAALAWSFGNVGYALTFGPCVGTTVQLSNPATLLGVFTLDAAGNYSFGPANVPGAACGNIWIQGIDLTSCEVTAALQP